VLRFWGYQICTFPLDLNGNLMIEQSHCVCLTSPNSPDYTGYRIIEFTDAFRPGSVIALQISLLPQIRQSVITRIIKSIFKIQ
jgi:hypothetical protein